MNIKKIKIHKQHVINNMGTSGLREKQEIYNEPLFLEQFAQGIADFFRELTDSKKTAENNKTIILGGDPRKGNSDRIKKISSILCASGFKVLIADNGLASTPAMSHAIRFYKAAGGIILTASHNPFTDVGIKINMADGSPALENTTSKITELQNSVTEISTADYNDAVKDGLIEYFNAIKLYSDLLDQIFSFSDMRIKIQKSKIKAAFDGMHGAAGPFAREVFINRLNIDSEIIREEPREDLGGFNENMEPMHPEPDFSYIPELIKLNSTMKYDLVSAWDSDVDRRLDGGSGFFIESADEFALFAKYSSLINIEKLFNDTLFFCRSAVTADQIDHMEDFLIKKFPGKKVKTVETPTGFKWIAELGNWGVEESNGVGNPYLREKDGIFSTVFLLKIILETGKTVKELMEEVWKDFGRVYFTRGEVSGASLKARDILTEILNSSSNSVGKKFGNLFLEKAGSSDYIHPETGITASKDIAWVFNFSEGNSIKARFSGTGSGGYLLRIYCSKYDKKFDIPKSKITKPMKEAFDAFLEKNEFNGKSKKYTDEDQPEVY